jgi:hypothetical protein
MPGATSNVSPRPPFIVTVNGANVVIVSGGNTATRAPRSPPEHGHDPTDGR